MPCDLPELLEMALTLPVRDRISLAECLLLSVDESHEPLIDEAILVECERRLDDFRSGRVSGIPAEEAFCRVREALSRSS